MDYTVCFRDVNKDNFEINTINTHGLQVMFCHSCHKIIYVLGIVVGNEWTNDHHQHVHGSENDTYN